jgi:hypothetical protein
MQNQTQAPAFFKFKEELRKDIADSVAKAFVQMGEKGNQIDWSISNPRASSSKGRKAA